jgi:hypothetical protein
MEGVLEQLKAQFSPKIILVNHEKRLNVDLPCSNLGIKYNFIYLSVYQMIRDNIQN